MQAHLAPDDQRVEQVALDLLDEDDRADDQQRVGEPSGHEGHERGKQPGDDGAHVGDKGGAEGDHRQGQHEGHPDQQQRGRNEYRVHEGDKREAADVVLKHPPAAVADLADVVLAPVGEQLAEASVQATPVLEEEEHREQSEECADQQVDDDPGDPEEASGEPSKLRLERVQCVAEGRAQGRLRDGQHAAEIALDALEALLHVEVETAELLDHRRQDQPPTPALSASAPSRVSTVAAHDGRPRRPSQPAGESSTAVTNSAPRTGSTTRPSRVTAKITTASAAATSSSCQEYAAALRSALGVRSPVPVSGGGPVRSLISSG
ncbi:MAG: hypothetical protein AVDCRST_MAG45-2355 [uncultured Solirubrobacterales bacterium]|uniref:Uncharacterized protein n=1 Tax=uncultured Solirubrobacterales bacterium TaxID=768556 RepID=A0A6J4TAI9_9ACTN|nr:MAG: hypothetical protein AVDCRST_MAG45-2355 [uncultured Solirubrobacterales bacterium]